MTSTSCIQFGFESQPPPRAPMFRVRPRSLASRLAGHAPLRRAPGALLRSHARQGREGSPLMRHGLMLGGIALGRGDHLTSKGPVDDHVALAARAASGKLSAAVFPRRLRQGYKQGQPRLSRVASFAAEIRKGCCVSLNIVVIRGKPQVSRTPALLSAFDLYRVQNLTELSGKRFSGAWLLQLATCIVKVLPLNAWRWLAHCSARTSARGSTPECV